MIDRYGLTLYESFAPRHRRHKSGVIPTMPVLRVSPLGNRDLIANAGTVAVHRLVSTPMRSLASVCFRVI
jgi:hypothetical protein